MSSNNIPVARLNYAKGRNKSKGKEVQDDKKSIQPTFQTDIFAHLNQDNLNYIKKQLKNKKSLNSQQKNINSNNTIKSTNLYRQKSQQIIVIESINSSHSIDNQLFYNNNNNNNNEDNISPIIRSSQLTFASNSHYNQNNNQIKRSLEPPPSIFSSYKQSKNQRYQQQQQQLKQQAQEQSQRKTFLSYELKSQQNSIHQLNQPIRTGEHLLSETGSVALQASQFIDYLQTYIVELNTINDFNKNKNKSAKLSKQQSIKSSKTYSIRDKNNQSNQQTKYNKQYSRYPPIHELENQNIHAQNNPQIKIQELQRQLEKQKFYSVTLACQLQKYKLNQEKYKREVEILKDTLKLIIKQTNHMKLTLDEQINKNKEIQNKVKNMKKIKKQSNHQKNTSIHGFNYQKQQNNLPRKSTQNQIEQFMNLTNKNPIYNDLDPEFYNRLINSFQEGQHSYQLDRQYYGKQNKEHQIINKINKPFNHQQPTSNSIRRYRKKQSKTIYRDPQISNFRMPDPKRPQNDSLQKLKQEYRKFKQQTKNIKRDQVNIKKQVLQQSYRSKDYSNAFQ